MSDTNRVGLGLIREGLNHGTIPTNPEVYAQRITGTPNLAYAPKTVVSNELRADRQVSDLILTDTETGGDENFEVSFDAQKWLFEGALQNDWEEQPYFESLGYDSCVSVTGVTSNGSGKVRFTRAAYEFSATGGFRVGGILYFHGMSISSTMTTSKRSLGNGIGKITAVGTGSITVGITISGFSSSDGAGYGVTANSFIVQVGLAIVSGKAKAVSTISNGVATNSLVLSTGAGVSFTTFSSDLVVGKWVYVRDITGSAAFPKGWCRISAVAATTLTFDIVPSSWAADTGASSEVLVFFKDKYIMTAVNQENLDDATLGMRFYFPFGADMFHRGELVYISGFSNNSDTLFAISSGAGISALAAASMRSFIDVTSMGTVVVDEFKAPNNAMIRAVGIKAMGNGGLVTTISPSNLIVATTAAGFSFTDFDIQEGDWLKLYGFASAASNEGWVRVSSISAKQIALDRYPSTFSAIVPTSMASIFFGDRLVNGTTEKSYTLERVFNDINVYEYFKGMEVNTLTLNARSSEVLNGSASFMGMNTANASTRASLASGAVDIAAPTFDILNASSNVGRIAEDGSPISNPNYIMEMTLSINNNLRRKNAIGNIGAIGIGAGEINVSGNVNTYFGNKTLLDKLLATGASAETSLDFRFEMEWDSTNDLYQALLIDIPKAKYSSGSPDVPGKNQDVMLNMGFQSYMAPYSDSTLGDGRTIQIQQFHYFK